MLCIINIINIIQSECRSPDISGVYNPIRAKFCERVSLWTKGAEKYPNFGHLDIVFYLNIKIIKRKCLSWLNALLYH